jgi:hypothetical protein
VTEDTHSQVEAESDAPGKGVARTSAVVGRTTAGKGPTSALRFGVIRTALQSLGSRVDELAIQRKNRRAKRMFCAEFIT